MILRFVLEMLAAFIFWGLKGFKGKLSDEVSDPNNRRSAKALRNMIVSMLILALIYILL